MAYAFNKVDDYFRRNKTGNQGSLEKGNMGAPAPTAAAENLAKAAETSGQQGASETGQFRAAKSANTAAIQSSLTQPATSQVQNWTTAETARAGDATKAGEANIAKQYQAFNAGDVAKAEAGQANPLSQQINYTGKELTFNPYQVQMPAIESQQQLAGGVGGMQAALQQQRGGRYTAGMGALDASVLASSNQGMQGVRSALGGLRESARGTQQQLEQTDENLAAKAGTTATSTRDAVRAAIKARTEQLATAQQAKANAEAQRLQAASQAGMTPEAFYQALLGTGKLSADDLAYMQSAEYGQKRAQYSPHSTSAAQLSAKAQNPNFRKTMANTYTQAIDPAYQNLANIWNIQGGDQMAPVASTAAYDTYAYDTGALGNVAQNAATNAQMVRSIRGVAGGSQAPIAPEKNMSPGAQREFNQKESAQAGLEREFETGGTGGWM